MVRISVSKVSDEYGSAVATSRICEQRRVERDG